MDNDNTNQRTLKKPAAYQTLGKKVFWLFFLQTSPAAFLLLLISIIILILSFQPFLENEFSGNMQNYALYASLIVFIISMFVMAISYAFAWLTYINYTFLLAEDSFKIKRGIFNKTENAIPYSKIQNADIERSFLFQMLGLSR